MTFIYYVREIYKRNGELDYNEVTRFCASEALARREIQKRIEELCDDKGDLFHDGEPVSKNSYRDGAGWYHLILVYEDGTKFEFSWCIWNKLLIES